MRRKPPCVNLCHLREYFLSPADYADKRRSTSYTLLRDICGNIHPLISWKIIDKIPNKEQVQGDC